MSPRCSNANDRALTLFELIVVCAIITVLAAFFLPVLASAKRKSARIHCVNDLKQIGLANLIWAGDNNDLLPMQVSVTNGGAMEPAFLGNATAIFQVMSNELSTPKILVCPNDSRHRFATNFATLSGTNISYFAGLDSGTNYPQNCILSGDANLILNGSPVQSGLLTLASNAVVKWSASRTDYHSDYGNLGFNDGSVQQFKLPGFANALAQTGLATNRLAIP